MWQLVWLESLDHRLSYAIASHPLSTPATFKQKWFWYVLVRLLQLCICWADVQTCGPHCNLARSVAQWLSGQPATPKVRVQCAVPRHGQRVGHSMATPEDKRLKRNICSEFKFMSSKNCMSGIVLLVVWNMFDVPSFDDQTFDTHVFQMAKHTTKKMWVFGDVKNDSIRNVPRWADRSNTLERHSISATISDRRWRCQAQLDPLHKGSEFRLSEAEVET